MLFRSVTRSEDEWRDLLGADRLALALHIARATDEDLSSAATRVWVAGESLVKLDVPPAVPIRLSDRWPGTSASFDPSHPSSGVVWLSAAGHVAVMTCLLSIETPANRVAVGVALSPMPHTRVTRPLVYGAAISTAVER